MAHYTAPQMVTVRSDRHAPPQSTCRSLRSHLAL
jgi:hypothetical protein